MPWFLLGSCHTGISTYVWKIGFIVQGISVSFIMVCCDIFSSHDLDISLVPIVISQYLNYVFSPTVGVVFMNLADDNLCDMTQATITFTGKVTY